MTQLATVHLGPWDMGQLLLAPRDVLPAAWSERQGGRLRFVGPNSTRLEAAGPFGELRATSSRLQRGMTVTTIRASLSQTCSLTALGRGMLVLNFVSNGLSMVQGHRGLRATLGTCLVRMHGEGEHLGSMLPGEQVYAGVRIAIEPLRLIQEFELPGGLDWLLARIGGCQLFDLDRATARIVAEMLELDVEHIGATLRLEGLALQLLATAIAWLYREHGHPDGRPALSGRLSPREERQVHAVRQILMMHYSDPPRVEELARRVGTNAGKLARGFRTVFGESLAACSLRLRMEKAHALLRDEGVSVAEAGYAVGYQHHSSFTAAFGRYFGFPPSEVGRRGASQPGSGGATK